MWERPGVPGVSALSCSAPGSGEVRGELGEPSTGTDRKLDGKPRRVDSWVGPTLQATASAPRPTARDAHSQMQAPGQFGTPGIRSPGSGGRAPTAAISARHGRLQPQGTGRWGNWCPCCRWETVAREALGFWSSMADGCELQAGMVPCWCRLLAGTQVFPRGLEFGPGRRPCWWVITLPSPHLFSCDPQTPQYQVHSVQGTRAGRAQGLCRGSTQGSWGCTWVPSAALGNCRALSSLDPGAVELCVWPAGGVAAAWQRLATSPGGGKPVLCAL